MSIFTCTAGTDALLATNLETTIAVAVRVALDGFEYSPSDDYVSNGALAPNFTYYEHPTLV